jgi:hypothetical protein
LPEWRKGSSRSSSSSAGGWAARARAPDRQDHGPDGVTVLRTPELREGAAFQLPLEQSVGARAGQAEGEGEIGVDLQHERVGENPGNGRRIDGVALRRRAGAAQFVPIGEKLA